MKNFGSLRAAGRREPGADIAFPWPPGSSAMKARMTGGGFPAFRHVRIKPLCGNAFLLFLTHLFLFRSSFA
jgi:hypothetical protein